MQTQLEILGFDRVGFVHEVSETVAQYGHIEGATFEADGVRSVGKLRLQLENEERLNRLIVRLKTIVGLVKVTLTIT
ncbi:MAG: hypothetical protein MUE30_19310 [Spirosomaceae bacterium]|jgi:hypothetical protein|nr:hypothetical protein [Spirosomataceae bacterium]